MESILRLSIDGFVDEVRRELDRLASDLAQGSLADGRRGVHSIKGLASTVGATQLSALALTAESEWKAGIALARAHELHTQLEALYTRTLPALQAVQAGLSED